MKEKIFSKKLILSLVSLLYAVTTNTIYALFYSVLFPFLANFCNKLIVFSKEKLSTLALARLEQEDCEKPRREKCKLKMKRSKQISKKISKNIDSDFPREKKWRCLKYIEKYFKNHEDFPDNFVPFSKADEAFFNVGISYSNFSRQFCSIFKGLTVLLLLEPP